MKKPKIIGNKKTGYLAVTEHCDYCGGRMIYKELPDNKEMIITNQDVIGLHIEYSITEPNLDRKVCIPCWIKTFDKVLGKHK